MKLKISDIEALLKKSGYKKWDIKNGFPSNNIEKIYFKYNSDFHIQATGEFWFSVVAQKNMFRGERKYHYGDKYSDTCTDYADVFWDELNKMLNR